MNRYKWLVFGLLGGMMVFHFSAIAYIKGNRYELTSKDYYALEQEHQVLLDRLNKGKALQWQIEVDPSAAMPRLTVLTQAGEPAELGTLKLHWYRPNDSSQDRQVEMEPLNAGANWLEGDWSSGRWDLLIETIWQGQEVAYRTSLHMP